jgi:hypothetical protein
LGRRRPIGLRAALDLFFVGHAPWSLWLLVMAGLLALALPYGIFVFPDLIPFLLTGVVPLVWTAVILFAFCRTVLGLGRSGAWIAVLLYEGVVWSIAVVYVGVTTQTWARWPGPR